jgi:hypothetical protein
MGREFTIAEKIMCQRTGHQLPAKQYHNPGGFEMMPANNG